MAYKLKCKYCLFLGLTFWSTFVLTLGIPILFDHILKVK